MTLPLLLSVPHAGLEVPPEAEPYCILTPQEIVEDGDEGAAEIYLPLEGEVTAFVSTPIARAILDMNRAEDDRRPDGVVKTHTCWKVPIYREALPGGVAEALLSRYWRPYHRRLSELARSGVRMGIDCHTMASRGPPVGPDPGKERPKVCLAHGEGTLPRPWLESLASALDRHLGGPVALNDPFRGGYVIQSHARELPWVQMEVSRAPFLTTAEKRVRILRALSDWASASC